MIHLIAKKTLEKLYMYESPFQNYTVLRTESDFTNNAELQKTEFEHLIDRTIRLKDTASCMAVDTTNTITFNRFSKQTIKTRISSKIIQKYPFKTWKNGDLKKATPSPLQ